MCGAWVPSIYGVKPVFRCGNGGGWMLFLLIEKIVCFWGVFGCFLRVSLWIWGDDGVLGWRVLTGEV